MTSSARRRRLPVFGAAILGCAVLAAPAAAANLAPATTLTASPARSTSGAAAVGTPAAPANVITNRPTMSMAAYRAAKATFASRQGAAKPGAASPTPFTAPTVSGFNGIAQSGADGFFPSDVNGAVSTQYNALTVNDHFVVYSKSGTVKKNVTLNSFFGYGTESMFDPRVVYDSTWKRFVVSADSFEESGTTQIFGLAITQTSNPTGPIWDYLLNFKGVCGNGNFVDYPQISTSQDAVIITVNCFQDSNNAYLGSAVIGLAKATVYNGQGFSVPVFRYFNTTATPPNVLDGNPVAHIILGGGGASVSDLPFNNPQGGFYASMGAPVAYSGWFTPSVPPHARQAGCSTTSCQIDTSDGRFVSPSTQVGTSLWNVATYALGSFAAPFWGEFDTTNHNLKQDGDRFLSSTSDDYNASLVSGADGRMFMNWSSSSPTAFVSQVVAARKSTDAAGSLPTMLVAKQSSSELTGDFDSNFGAQRWGDTSQVTRDPAKATTVYAWNQWVPTSSGWGTFSAKFVNP